MIKVVPAADICPKCGGVTIARCRCPLADRMCGNGHHWHNCPECGTVCAWEGDHGSGKVKNLCGDCRKRHEEEDRDD